MKKILFSIIALASVSLVAMAQDCTPATTNDVTVNFCNKVLLPGEFSVSATEKVRFSSGNLQWKGPWVDAAHPGTWRFAPNQWDCLGSDTEIGGNTTTGDANRKVQTKWIDLFGYGTSGEQFQPDYMPSSALENGPWTSIENKSYYYSSTKVKFYVYEYYYTLDYSDNLQYDWGIKNRTELNSDNVCVSGEWKVLTKDQWTYLINTRTNAASKRAFCTVNEISGLVLLPDVFTWPEGLSFSNKTYALNDWKAMEAAGAVFLPATGYRTAVECTIESTSVGYYWSSSVYSGEYTGRRYATSFAFAFSNSATNILQTARDKGCSVRLVHFVPAE